MMGIKNGIKVKWIVCVALLLGMCLISLQSVDVWAKDSQDRTIKVFFPLQEGFAQIDGDGNYSGYTYEYLMKVAQLTGWKYEFVPVEMSNDNLLEGLDKVAKGEFHLSGAMNYTDELAEKYEYSIPYGSTSFALVTREDNKKLNARTLIGYKNLKVATIKAAEQQNSMFDKFCKENGIEYELVYAENNSECRQFIEEGVADVTISKDVSRNIEYKILAKYNSSPFYFAAAKGETELIQQLNSALRSIEISDSSFEIRMYEKYFPLDSGLDLPLSEAEMEYLDENPVVKVAVLGGRAPIQDYDEKTGKFSGIIVDIMDKISVKTGIKFDYLYAEDENALMEYIRNGNCDIIAGISYTYSQEGDLGNVSDFLLTPPVFSAPIIRISNRNGEGTEKEILVAGSIKTFQGKESIRYNSDIKDIFKMVNSGKYKEAYVNGYMAQHIIESGEYPNVSLTFTPYGNYELCLGIAREYDLKLSSILNQAIAALDSSEIEDIVYKNTNKMNEGTIWGLIKNDPSQVAIPLLIVLIIVLFLLTLLFLKTKRLNQLISKEKNEYKIISQTDRLSQTYNNAGFKQLAINYLSQKCIDKSVALLVCDIDNFKNINDTYGHLKGDEVISCIGKHLKKVFQGNNIVGRLGGDEFVVMMKEGTNREIIEMQCKKLQEKCSEIMKEERITLSIGIAVYNSNIDFDVLFKKADEVLYDVKKNGKNFYKIYEENSNNS